MSEAGGRSPILYAVVFLIIGLIIGGVVGYFAAPPKIVTKPVAGGTATVTVTATATTTKYVTVTATPAAAGGIPKEIPVGVLVSMTGALASAGPYYKAAAELAVEDVNKWLAEMGLPYRVKLYLEDEKTSPEGALAAVQSLAARGVKIVIPYTSGDCRAIYSFINEHKIVAISYASTAIALGIPNDYLFRLVPTDAYQSKALAKLMWVCGVRKAVVVYRGDEWGSGLYEEFKKDFEALGGKVIGIKYDPSAPDLSPEARKAEDHVRSLGAGKDVGLLAISFTEDFVSFFTAAKESKVLMSIKWFGTDGTVCSTRIRDTFGEVIDKAGIGFLSTYYEVGFNPRQASFIERYKKKTGERPESYQFALYDCIWVATLSVLVAGKYDGEAIKNVLPRVAETYFGLTGWCKLNENGDRGVGDYAIWTLNATRWFVIAHYSGTTDAITWTPEGKAWLKAKGWTISG